MRRSKLTLVDIAGLLERRRVKAASAFGSYESHDWDEVRSCRLTFEDLAVQAQQSREESVVSHRRVAFEDGYDSAHERDAEQWILPIIHEQETKRDQATIC